MPENDPKFELSFKICDFYKIYGIIVFSVPMWYIFETKSQEKTSPVTLKNLFLLLGHPVYYF